VVAILVFIFATAIQYVQVGLNTQLASTNWFNDAIWQSFKLANEFVNNFWIYLLVFAVFGVLYYGYVTAQKQGAGL
jgi:hypothetical protein